MVFGKAVKRLIERQRAGWTRVRANPWPLLEALLNGAVFLAYVAMKVRAFAGKAPIYTGDKRIWATIAEEPLFGRFFLLPRRPIVYPLLFKTGLSDPQIITVQLWLSIFSWGLLGYAVSRLVPRLLRTLVFSATLLLALVTPVNAWDLLIRAESTSHSLVVLTFACALLFSRALTQGRRRAIAWASATVVAGTACAFARDTNPFLLLLLLPTLGVWVWAARRQSKVTLRTLLATSLSLSLALGAAAFTAQWTARAAPRFDFPLMNVIFKRILPNPIKRDYFVRELGMPLSRALMSRSGKFASANGRRAYVDPALGPFRVWLFTDGYSAYQRYLLTHFELSVREALSQFSPIVAYIPLREGLPSTTTLTPFADDWFIAGVWREAPLEACAVFIGVGLLASLLRSRNARTLGALSVFLVLATLSQLFLCVHGDAMEVQRHSVMVGILLRLALVVCVAIVASSLREGARVAARWLLARRANARTRANRAEALNP